MDLTFTHTNRDIQRSKTIVKIGGENVTSSIYKFGLSVCLSVCFDVCLFVSNKRQNGWTDRAQIFCGTSRDHREGLWMIKFSKICLNKNLIFVNFENPWNFFFKSVKFLVFVFFNSRVFYFEKNILQMK